jgi:heat shock protein HtpX
VKRLWHLSMRRYSITKTGVIARPKGPRRSYLVFLDIRPGRPIIDVTGAPLLGDESWAVLQFSVQVPERLRPPLLSFRTSNFIFWRKKKTVKRVLLFVITNLAIVFILSIVLSLLGVGRILDEQGVGLNMYNLLVFAAVFGFGGSLISLAISKWTAKRLTGARVIKSPSNEAEAWLVQTVRKQAEIAGIGMPEVAVYDARDLNAFATGARRNKALVAVSTGLLRSMNREEVEAVLAHEVSHVANGDMITLALIQGVVNTFVIVASRVVGHFVDRVVFKTEEGHGPAFFITAIIAQIVFGILASIIVFWFSRRREFRADAGSARLAGREKMIAALDKLRRSVNQPHLPDQMAAFGISGKGASGLKRLFMTHPPLEERIEALRQHR